MRAFPVGQAQLHQPPTGAQELYRQGRLRGVPYAPDGAEPRRRRARGQRPELHRAAQRDHCHHRRRRPVEPLGTLHQRRIRLARGGGAPCRGLPLRQKPGGGSQGRIRLGGCQPCPNAKIQLGHGQAHRCENRRDHARAALGSHEKLSGAHRAKPREQRRQGNGG